MQPALKLVKRHKDITLLFLKHAQLAAAPSIPVQNSAECPKAAELAKDLEALGPTFTRMARLLVGRKDLLPENYLGALANVRDHLAPEDFQHPENFETVESIIEDELGKKLTRAFQTFDSEPYEFVGIGQLHRATLPNGKEVTVKIQRPGLRQQMVKDLDSLADIASFLDQQTPLGQRIKFAKLIDRFRVEMMAELDYRREANHLAELGRTTSPYTQIALPVVVDELTSSRVLTTNRLEGTKISDLPGPLDEEAGGEAAADDLVGSYAQQLVALGIFHSNPHSSNHLFTPEQSIAVLEFGPVSRLSAHTKSQLALFLTGLSERNAVRTTDAAIRLSKYNDEEINRSALLENVRSFFETEPVCLGNRVLRICGIFAQTGVVLPSEIGLIGKMLINLRQICERLSPGFNSDLSFQRHLEELSRQRDETILPFPERLTSVI